MSQEGKWALGGGLAAALAIVVATGTGHGVREVGAAAKPPKAGVVRVPALEHAESMGAHMSMTRIEPAAPGDQERAAAILAAAKTFAAKYTDYHKAEADGYKVAFPNSQQTLYHFLRAHPRPSSEFDANEPPILIYVKPGQPGKPEYKLAGVMYTAPVDSTLEQLNARVPLSVGQWHTHLDVCYPADVDLKDWVESNPRWGIDGSITTAAECAAAGGKFHPTTGLWMVHVFPFESDPANVWQSGMDMAHHGAPVGMKM